MWYIFFLIPRETINAGIEKGKNTQDQFNELILEVKDYSSDDAEELSNLFKSVNREIPDRTIESAGRLLRHFASQHAQRRLANSREAKQISADLMKCFQY